jgi:hypothetical protein
MIDFKNGLFFKLTPDKAPNAREATALLIGGEEVLSTFTAGRDYLVFTNKRIISVNVQGITGKKRDFTTLPYSKISAYSVETAGTFDLDSELDLYYSGVGRIRFEFKGSSDILEIGRIIARYALR